jgi:hypothetical protein
MDSGKAHFLKTLSKSFVAGDPRCIGLIKIQQIPKETLGETDTYWITATFNWIPF